MDAMDTDEGVLIEQLIRENEQLKREHGVEELRRAYAKSEKELKHYRKYVDQKIAKGIEGWKDSARKRINELKKEIEECDDVEERLRAAVAKLKKKNVKLQSSFDQLQTEYKHLHGEWWKLKKKRQA